MTTYLSKGNLHQEIYRFENDYGVLITHHEPEIREIATIRFDYKTDKWKLSDVFGGLGGNITDELMEDFAAEVASLPDF